MEAKEAIVLDRDGNEIHQVPPRSAAVAAKVSRAIGMLAIVAAGSAALFAGFAIIATVVAVFLALVLVGAILRALGLSSGPRVRTIVIRR